jgi:hypothetical protein
MNFALILLPQNFVTLNDLTIVSLRLSLRSTI